MKPIKIKLNNFLTYQGEHELDLSNISSAIISGPNGAGKSSLLIDSILYALYGKSRKTLDTLIYETENEMSVNFLFSHNRKNYRVLRNQKESKQSLKFYYESEDISERLLTSTQEKLDKLLGISYELLLATAMSQQEDINKLSVISPSEREKILSEMLCIQQWEIKKKKVLEKLNEYKDLDSQIKETNKIILDGQVKIGFIDDELKTYNLKLKSLTDLKEIAEIKVKELEDILLKANKFNEIEKKKLSLSTEIKFLKEQKSDLEKSVQFNDVQSIQSGILQIDNEIKEGKELIEEVSQEIKKLESELDEIAQKRTLAASLLSEEKKLALLNTVPCTVYPEVNKSCELLKTSWDAKEAIDVFLKENSCTSLKEFIDTKLKIINEIKNKISNYSKDITDLKDFSNKYLIKKNDLQIKLKDFDKLTEINNKLIIKDTALNELEKIKLDKIDFSTETYTDCKNNLNGLNKQIQQITILIAESESEIKFINENLVGARSKLNDYNAIQSNVANYRLLYNAFNDIPTLLFEQAIPTLEKYTNEILQNISNGKEIELRSFKETKSNTLQKALDVVGIDGRDYYNLSGSEKVRQSLALRIALSRYNSEQNNIEMPFFIVDEGGFGSLDPENRYSLKLMLQNIAKEFELFLVITHLEELSDTFDNQILVNLNGKGKKIEIL